jgi:hypothetical protein
MLSHAILRFSNSQEQYIAVLVTNFPVLPIGSNVYIYFTKEVRLEGATITGYSADNKTGTQIDINLGGNAGLSDELIDEIWQKVAVECVEDTGNLCNLIYPIPIDFSVKYPLPPPDMD